MFDRFKKAKAKNSLRQQKPQTAAAKTSQSEELEIEGVRVILTTKRVKNINMRVKAPDGVVTISAPPRTSRAVIEAFVRAKLAWIHQRQAEIEASPRTTLTAEEKAALKAKIEPQARALIDQWETRMGVVSESLAFRDMTSRWGSCNPRTGRICLNIQLANYPEECLEYVVVHELCHLLERGHGPRFKALMDEYLPDWRTRRALLR